MKRYIKTIAWCLVAAFVLFTFYFLWKQSQPETVYYELLSPEVRTLERKSIATGQIEPRRQVTVKPRITGILYEIDVVNGQAVELGQLIGKVRIIPDMNAVNEALSSVETARLHLDEVSKETERVKNLYAKKVVSKEEFEKANHSLALAQESYRKAEAAYDIVRQGSSKRGGDINTTEVRATMAGTIIDLPLKEGASVVATSPYTEGTTIAVIADMSDMIFEGKIDETEVTKLHKGQKTVITVGAAQGSAIDGTLEEIATLGVKENGTIMFKIKTSVGAAAGLQRAGFSANAEFITQSAKDVLSIEETAIMFEGSDAYVYVLTSGPESKAQKFEKRAVKVGMSDGIHIEVKDGLAKGDSVRGNKLN